MEVQPNEVDTQSNIRDYVYSIFKNNFSQHFLYHNFRHFHETVEMAHELCEHYQMPEDEAEDIEIAAWFHDLGYFKSYEHHEKHSTDMAVQFMTERNYEPYRIERVKSLINCTRLNEEPKNFMEEILVDADLQNIGRNEFFSRGSHLKHEWGH